MAGEDVLAVNAEVLNRYATAWMAGDIKTIFACYHDDFTVHYDGRNPLAGTHAGKPAALAAMAEISRRSGRRLVEVMEVLPGVRRSVLVVRESFHRDDLTAEVERVLTYAIRDGLFHACWVHDQDQALIDKFLA